MKKIVLLLGAVLVLAVIVPGFAQAKSPQVLMVVTSAGQIRAGKPTGLWLEEFAVPYLKFRDAGFKITVASIKGGDAPVDPRSLQDKGKVQEWSQAAAVLEKTTPLAKVKATNFDAIFLPGGHGTMFDLPNNRTLQKLLYDFSKGDKVIAAVCHGPAGFVGAKKGDGTPLVAGVTVTSFTDEEERAVQLDKEMPFLLETKLREEGAKFVAGEKWGAHVEVDGKLVTGQNPASSEATADAVIKLLK